MKTSQILGSLLIALLVFGDCNERPYNIFNGEFRHVEYTGAMESLIGETVDINDIGVFFTWIADSLLFVKHDARVSDAFFSVYSLNSFQPLFKNFILKGNCPNEFFHTEMVRLFADSTGIKAWIEVNYRSKLICVDVTASILKQRIMIEKEIELDIEDKSAALRVFYDTDTSIIVQSLFNNDQMSAYNPISRKTRFIGWLYSEEYDNQNSVDLYTNYVYNVQKAVLA